jgi:phosphatidylserine/phosphatidylglycerophosphate/cardiolipin synthase-like enzyme
MVQSEKPISIPIAISIWKLHNSDAVCKPTLRFIRNSCGVMTAAQVYADSLADEIRNERCCGSYLSKSYMRHNNSRN